MESIGDLTELGELKVEWKIRDFISLSEEINAKYHSPIFYFCGESWQIKLYPNGTTRFQSNGWISLFITRRSSGSSLKIDYVLSVWTDKENIGSHIFGKNREFFRKGHYFGFSKLIPRSHLLYKFYNEDTPDTITVRCHMKNSESYNITGSLLTRHQALSDSLKEIFIKRKKSDICLKVGGDNLFAHQIILEARSPVFRAMFNHGTKESQTREIIINDIERNTMEAILLHIYTGDVSTPTTGNVFSLYAVAEKYLIKEVKDICSDFIIRNLSEDWLLDVIKFNELYQNTNISHRTRTYFTENIHAILMTEKWKAFAKENPDISIELLSSIVKTIVPEKSAPNNLAY